MCSKGFDTRKTLVAMAVALTTSTTTFAHDPHLPFVPAGGNYVLLVIVASLTLTGAFYFSLRRLSNAVRKQKRMRSIEKRLLLTQLQPHFVFNCLSGLMGTIQNEEAQRYLQDFSRLLRSSLESLQCSFVSLRFEMESLEWYIRLQQRIRGRQFRYQISTTGITDQDMDHIQVLPMLFQPIVENSIEHGFRTIDRLGEIDIHLEKDGDQLVCVIADNGTGLQPSVTRVEHRHFGLQLVADRLRLLAEETRLPVYFEVRTAEKGPGTIAFMRLPLQHLHLK